MTDPTWVHRAVGLIEADFQRSADTHLIKLDLPAWPGHPIYLKDESCHPSGSLKHRLARSLFLYGLCNGWIGPGTPIIESSSGNTAISEAYFARLLGLPFYAVMPRSTSPDKIEQIGFYGGHCHLVDGTDIYSAATALAAELGGHYMDQFTYAERATDWRGNNNIAESIFEQMRREDQPIPRWIVVSAGTGGTSATIGRYIRYHAACAGITQLCVADPERSVFYDYFHSGDRSLRAEQGSRIEGIGRPRVEPSFLRSVVDRMLKVDDNASLAALQVLRQLTGRALGGSSGTHFVACCHLISEMAARGETGSVVTLICDSGDRYRGSYHNEQWLDEQGFELGPQRKALEGFLAGKPYSLA